MIYDTNGHESRDGCCAFHDAERLRSEVASLRERAERAERRADEIDRERQETRDRCFALVAERDEAQERFRKVQFWEDQIERLEGEVQVLNSALRGADTLAGERDAAEAESASLRSALESIVTEWEKDLDGAEECFPLLERARAALSRRVPPGKEGT